MVQETPPLEIGCSVFTNDGVPATLGIATIGDARWTEALKSGCCFGQYKLVHPITVNAPIYCLTRYYNTNAKARIFMTLLSHLAYVDGFCYNVLQICHRAKTQSIAHAAIQSIII